jgi:hypothetical protein
VCPSWPTPRCTTSNLAGNPAEYIAARARAAKGPSKTFRSRYGHTPLTADEDIPWSCRRLVVGTGAAGSLPVADELIAEAERRGVELVVLPTAEAIELLRTIDAGTNAILHVTC